MSAVVEFVSDTWDAAVDFVGDVVEFVGDTVSDVVEVVGDVIEYVAENPEVLIIAVAAPQLLPSIGITGIAVQPVTAALISASQGGDLEDIGKAALGSFVGQGVGIPVAKGVGNVVGTGSAAQVALANAAGGAVGSAAGAAVTGQDIGEAALMGAAGSAGASLARSGAGELGQQPQSLAGDVAADVGEALGRTAAGGDLRQELVGAALGSLTREGQMALDELRTRPETDATKQAIAAFSEPRSPGVGTQLGEATAELGGAIVPATRTDIEEARRLGIELPESNMKALPMVTVTGKPDTFDVIDIRTGRIIPSSSPSGDVTPQNREAGFTSTAPEQIGDLTITKTGQYAKDRVLPEVVVTATKPGEGEGLGDDVRTGRVIPSSLPSGEAKTAGTAGGVTTTPPAGAERETPAAREETAAAAPEPLPAPEDMTGAELIESAAAGEETPSLPEVEVVGEEEPDVRIRTPRDDQLAEAPIDFTEMTDAELIEYLNQEFPLTPPEADFKPLDVRRAGGTTRRAAPRSISPRVVGTSPTAAIVGQKEPIFGGEEDAQQSVWNTRSLRLRKALGG